MERIVVVGAGLAGSRAVTALREQGFAGELVLVGAEQHRPYDRPPLSKRVLLSAGREPYDSTLPLDADGLVVDVRLGTRATGLRPGVLETSGGELAYDGLVIATGSTPVRLAGEHAHYLRTREDALALRDRLHSKARVVVVGAGWIGAEVATAAATHGCHVTVIEQAATPVAHALPPAVGGRMVPWYAEAGVELHRRTRVRRVHEGGVEVADGGQIPADVVVVGVGVRPATDWLADSPVDLDTGVVVGSDLATSMPGVVAAGDVAARWSPRYQARIRGEHWDDALRSPTVAASTLVRPGEAASYDPVPYVWSEQFGRMVQYAGHHEAGSRVFWREDPDRGPGWSVFWLDEGDRIVALLAVDSPRDFVQGRKLAAAGAPVDADLLTDTATPVRQSVATVAGSET